jgi:hypothetical protein
MSILHKPRFDIAAIVAANPIEEVVGRHVTLKKNGREWRGLCPFHNERTPSFTVVPATSDASGAGFYHCFGCGAHGDQFKFLMMMLGVTFPEACEILGGTREVPAQVRPSLSEGLTAHDPYTDLVAVTPPDDGRVVPGVMLECWNAKRADENPPKPICRLRPSMVFEYRDLLGFLLGFVLRCELPGGKKWTPQIRWARCPDGRERWALWHFETPRPLYRLDRLSLWRGPVWLVEGEKSADAATKLLGDLAITWPGGTNGAALADWSPLKGRDVHLWGDADQPGWDVMTGFPERAGSPARPGVISLATAAGARVLSVVRWDQSKPEGWDAGDAINEMSTEELRLWLRRQAIDGADVLQFAPMVKPASDSEVAA